MNIIENACIYYINIMYMQVFSMKNVRSYLLAGFFFTAISGTLSHFFFGWSGENPLIGLISPVNESTWEHMKLVFFPVLLWSFFLPQALSESTPSLRPSLLLGGILGTFLIPVLFYTYSGSLGYNTAWADIAIFFISVLAVYLFSARLQNSETLYKKRTAIYFLTVLLLILFFLFTFLPPDIALFADP